MSNALDTALMWRDLGIATIPILARSKAPAIDKWKPYQSRLPTEFELRAWFARPGYNIAVVTGWQGLVIVDFDSASAWDRFVNSIGLDVPLLYYVIFTPRGRHLYFYCAEATQCVSLDDIDIKANGGYCLAPPSVHPLGQAYTSIGSPDEIVRLESITDILPEYQQAIERPPPRPRVKRDILDIAMTPHPSTSIEEANDKLSYEQLLGSGRVFTHYLCPLHEDTQPSLKVYPDGGWYCFGCHASGRDKLDLYAKLNGMTIREALCTL